LLKILRYYYCYFLCARVYVHMMLSCFLFAFRHNKVLIIIIVVVVVAAVVVRPIIIIIRPIIIIIIIIILNQALRTVLE